MYNRSLLSHGTIGSQSGPFLAEFLQLGGSAAQWELLSGVAALDAGSSVFNPLRSKPAGQRLLHLGGRREVHNTTQHNTALQRLLADISSVRCQTRTTEALCCVAHSRPFCVCLSFSLSAPSTATTSSASSRNALRPSTAPGRTRRCTRSRRPC